MQHYWKQQVKNNNFQMNKIVVFDTTFAVGERKPEKNKACMGFEPLTSPISVQRSTSFLANKPTEDH